MHSTKQKIIIISGPTASGKSSLAFDLALKLDTQIISADSRQVYEEFDIGVNKPPHEMLERIRHYLVGNVPVKTVYSASEFKKDAAKYIDEISSRGKIPIICGGTGLYIRMLLQNKEMPPSDSFVRAGIIDRVEREGLPSLYSQLQNIDPDYADIISPNDNLRIVRAIEIYELSGHNMTYFNTLSSEPHYDYIHFILDIDRKKLYDAINQRTQAMLDAGLVDEVKYLVSKYSDNALLATIGYAEVVEYLREDITYDKMAELIAQHTRNYAKRQVIWNRKVIKNDPEHVAILHEPDADRALEILKERGFIL